MARSSHLTLVTLPDGARGAAWLATLAGVYAPAEVDALTRAIEWLNARLQDATVKGGEPALDHALNVATILRELKLDAECLVACLLVPVASGHDALVEIRDCFGARVAELADGVARMAMIESLDGDGARAEGPAQLEGLRKMLLAMAQDVRVVLIKLADHMQSMRYLVKCDDVQLRQRHGAPDARPVRAARQPARRVAAQVGARRPRVAHTGAGDIQAHRQPARRKAQRPRALHRGRGRRAARGACARAASRPTSAAGPSTSTASTTKCSRKQARFRRGLRRARRARAGRRRRGCYAALGVVHRLWTPLPREFDDYIAKPKGNDYRSLHTAVIGPDGKPLEIQIRTFEMHQHAEFGVAAHWRYKEGGARAAATGVSTRKSRGCGRSSTWKEEVADAGGLAAQFPRDLFADTIYVLTPQGRVIDLPRGATPVDFAYHVHTDLGHRCRGAQVNGAMVPLNTPLANGQQVEIIAAKQGGPSRDWLNPALGFLKSASARGKVRQWFNRHNHEVSVAEGREVVEKELQRQGMTSVSLEKLAQSFGFAKLADFFAEAGRGEISQRQLQIALRGEDAPASRRKHSRLSKSRARSQAAF